MISDKQKTADHWASNRGGISPTNWLCNEQVLREYVYPRFGCGNWYLWFRDRYCIPSRNYVLSLCCGIGAAERYFIRIGAFAQCHGIDLSERIVQEAWADPVPGLSFSVGDVEDLRLAPNSADMVMSWMALHHIRNLETVFAEIAQALCPGGLLLLNEYVGPAGFRYSPARREAMDRLLRELPPELRIDMDGHLREIAAPPPELVAAQDPSEAIRSDEILPIMGEHFEILDRIDYGGGLLHHVLSGSMQNFDPNNPAHCRWLRYLYAADRTVSSDFTFVVARPRP